MSVIRNTASAMQRGRVGNTTYYVINGQQVARQSKNNSNYGETASRSEAQQLRRVKWGNLVNLYKACKHWMPKAFESKKRNQSDYNRFMSVNINTVSAALTKDQALNGCAVVEDVVISQGSLPPIECGLFGGVPGSDIAVGSLTLSGATIQSLSQAIISNNAGFLDGDNIAVIIFAQSEDSRSYPYSTSAYYEFTLDTSNTALLTTLPISNIIDVDAQKLVVKASLFAATDNIGFAFIHTRKNSSALYVSTQSIALFTDTSLQPFTTDEWVQECIATYGVEADVELAPNFRFPTIEQVLINGGAVPSFQGRTLEYNASVELTISGYNINSDTLSLIHDDTAYTPLATGDNSVTFLLGGNGTNVIRVNGREIFRVVISGIVVPEGIPNLMSICQWQNGSTERFNGLILTTDCINYPYVANESLPRFFLGIGHPNTPFTDDDESHYTVHNATLQVFTDWTSTGRQLVMIPTDITKPCYVEYMGYIVAVFNYTE